MKKYKIKITAAILADVTKAELRLLTIEKPSQAEWDKGTDLLKKILQSADFMGDEDKGIYTWNAEDVTGLSYNEIIGKTNV